MFFIHFYNELSFLNDGISNILTLTNVSKSSFNRIFPKSRTDSLKIDRSNNKNNLSLLFKNPTVNK